MPLQFLLARFCLKNSHFWNVCLEIITLTRTICRGMKFAIQISPLLNFNVLKYIALVLPYASGKQFFCFLQTFLTYYVLQFYVAIQLFLNNGMIYSRFSRCCTARGPSTSLSWVGPAKVKASKSVLFTEVSSEVFHT